MKTIFLGFTFMVLSQISFSQQLKSNQKMDVKTNKVVFQDVYFVLITSKLKETVDFYSKNFGFKGMFESSWFHYLQSAGDHPFGLAIMDEKHPTQPPVLPAFNKTNGSFLTLQVADAKSEYEKLKSFGAKIIYELKEEPWGQKRFSLEDPNGLFIDVVQQTEPKAGWWDEYMN